jgi:hypothetical protein
MNALRAEAAKLLYSGAVIPAHPLALTARRTLDERRMRALTCYYLSAGAGGLAVGVHTTQFEVRDRKHGLLEPVLAVVGAAMKQMRPDAIRIAGICGPTEQAIDEARLARKHHYDVGLLSLAAHGNASNGDLLTHCRAVAEQLPLLGFYLQPAVGGRLLDTTFWRDFCRIDGVVGIKIAPFDRYGTLDVMRGVAESGRADDVALYTGNDDHIVLDLLTPFPTVQDGQAEPLRMVGGLLGQWAVWTHSAVALLERVHTVWAGDGRPDRELLVLANQLTEANQAIFDVKHAFRGCIPGIHEILCRTGLMAGRWCLDPALDLSPGQEEAIDRVCRAYPHLTDDGYVKEHLHEWLST